MEPKAGLTGKGVLIQFIFGLLIINQSHVYATESAGNHSVDLSNHKAILLVRELLEAGADPTYLLEAELERVKGQLSFDGDHILEPLPGLADESAIGDDQYDEEFYGYEGDDTLDHPYGAGQDAEGSSAYPDYELYDMDSEQSEPAQVAGEWNPAHQDGQMLQDKPSNAAEAGDEHYIHDHEEDGHDYFIENYSFSHDGHSSVTPAPDTVDHGVSAMEVPQPLEHGHDTAHDESKATVSADEHEEGQFDNHDHHEVDLTNQKNATANNSMVNEESKHIEHTQPAPYRSSSMRSTSLSRSSSSSFTSSARQNQRRAKKRRFRNRRRTTATRSRYIANKSNGMMPFPVMVVPYDSQFLFDPRYGFQNNIQNNKRRLAPTNHRRRWRQSYARSRRTFKTNF